MHYRHGPRQELRERAFREISVQIPTQLIDSDHIVFIIDSREARRRQNANLRAFKEICINDMSNTFLSAFDRACADADTRRGDVVPDKLDRRLGSELC